MILVLIFFSLSLNQKLFGHSYYQGAAYSTIKLNLLTIRNLKFYGKTATRMVT